MLSTAFSSLVSRVSTGAQSISHLLSQGTSLLMLASLLLYSSGLLSLTRVSARGWAHRSARYTSRLKSEVPGPLRRLQISPDLMQG